MQRLQAQIERFQTQVLFGSVCQHAGQPSADSVTQCFPLLVGFVDGSRVSQVGSQCAGLLVEPDRVCKAILEQVAGGFLDKNLNVLRLGLPLQRAVFHLHRKFMCSPVAAAGRFPAFSFDQIVDFVEIPLNDLDLGHLLGAQQVAQRVPRDRVVAGHVVDRQRVEHRGVGLFEQDQLVRGAAQRDPHLVDQPACLQQRRHVAAGGGQAHDLLVELVEPEEDDRVAFQPFDLAHIEEHLFGCALAAVGQVGQQRAQVDQGTAGQLGQFSDKRTPLAGRFGILLLERLRQWADEQPTMLVAEVRAMGGDCQLHLCIVEKTLAIGTRAQRLGQLGVKIPGVVDHIGQVAGRAALVAKLKLLRVGAQHLAQQIFGAAPIKAAGLNNLGLVAGDHDRQTTLACLSARQLGQKRDLQQREILHLVDHQPIQRAQPGGQFERSGGRTEQQPQRLAGCCLVQEKAIPAQPLGQPGSSVRLFPGQPAGRSIGPDVKLSVGKDRLGQPLCRQGVAGREGAPQNVGANFGVEGSRITPPSPQAGRRLQLQIAPKIGQVTQRVRQGRQPGELLLQLSQRTNMDTLSQLGGLGPQKLARCPFEAACIGDVEQLLQPPLQHQVAHQIKEGHRLAAAGQPSDGRRHDRGHLKLPADSVLFVEARVKADQRHFLEFVQRSQVDRVVSFVVMADTVDQDRRSRLAAGCTPSQFAFGERNPPKVVVIALHRGAPPASIVAGSRLDVGGAAARAQQHLRPHRFAADGVGQALGQQFILAVLQQTVARHRCSPCTGDYTRSHVKTVRTGAERGRKIFPVCGRENGLRHIVEHSKQGGAPRSVKLAHHIVQQKQRRRARSRHHLDLGQLEGQGGAALLPTAAVGAQVTAVGLKTQVIALGPVQRDASRHFTAAPAGQFAQIGSAHPGRVEHARGRNPEPVARPFELGVGEPPRVEAGQIVQAQRFTLPTQLPVAFGRQRCQLLQKSLAPHHDGGPLLSQLFVPEGQLGVDCRCSRVGGLFAQPLEQAVALLENLLEGGQGPTVASVELTERNIQIMTAFARPPIDQLDVSRKKEHSPQQADQIQGSSGRAVDLHLFGVEIAALGQQHLDRKLAPLLVDLTGNPAVGDRLFVGTPADDLALLAGVHGLAGGQHKDRFEQIGLALGVLALQQGERRVETQLQMLVVAEVVKGQAREQHTDQTTDCR